MGPALILTPRLAPTMERSPIKKKIPSSDELLPVIGMGSWQTFDVGDDVQGRVHLIQVLAGVF